MRIVILTIVVKNFTIATSKNIWTSEKFYAYDTSKFDHL